MGTLWLRLRAMLGLPYREETSLPYRDLLPPIVFDKRDEDRIAASESVRLREAWRPNLKEVLRLVNRARWMRGLSPIAYMPRGVPRKPGQCPLARAIEAEGVGYGTARFDSHTDALGVRDAWWGTSDSYLPAYCASLPDALDQFVWDFDHGLYPELVEQP